MRYPESDWPCPFCGVHAGVTNVEDPTTGKDEPAVVHGMPYCSKFEQMDATDFIRAAIDKYTGKNKGTN